MTGPFPAGWRIVGASACGSGHAADAAGNQDVWAYRRLTAGRFLLAVADGAGSRAYGALGARLAVEAAVVAARTAFTTIELNTAGAWSVAGEQFTTSCLRTFDTLVADTGRGLGTAVRGDFATTLLVVVASPPCFYYLSVGDCFLTVHRGLSGVHLVVPPVRGVDDSETVFLTSPGRDYSLCCGLIVDPEVTGLALCTDGLVEATLAVEPLASSSPRVRPAYLAPPEFSGYFGAFCDPSHPGPDLTATLHSPGFVASSADDKTMLLAVRQ